MSVKVDTTKILEERLNVLNEKLSDAQSVSYKDPKDNDEAMDYITKLNTAIELINVVIQMKKFEEEAKETIKKPIYQNINQIAASKGIYSGMACEAKWSGDNNWYKATVVNFNEFGIVVKFTGSYGNEEVVDPDDIRARNETTMSDTMLDRKNKAQETASASSLDQKGDLIIPRSLVILPTDSEEERKKKKKRIKSIKSKNRLKKTDETRNKRKNAWQSFQKEGSLKRKKASSIFQTPENPNGKVGVTGSGQGMTEFVVPKYNPTVLKKKKDDGTQMDSENDMDIE